MPRRRYETEQDLQNERDLVNLLLEVLGPTVEAYKLPNYSGGDFIMCQDGRARTIVEIKKRTCSDAQYPTIILSKGKYDRLVYWSEMGFKAILLVGWRDRSGYIRIPTPYVEATGGRTDRGDPMDVETVVHIQIADFTFLN